jgi:DNA-binding transcriptional LysR family regulator
MIWKTKTHQFSATLCQKTGNTCPALAQMARAIVQAMESAVPATSDDFALDGSGELGHCPQGCIARFRAQKDQIRIFCGTSTDASLDALDGYADMLFGPDAAARPAGQLPVPPCAMLEVSELAPAQPAQPQQHLAL